MTSDDCEQRLAISFGSLHGLRHAVERLLALVGLLCGMGVAIVTAKIILGIAGSKEGRGSRWRGHASG